MFKKLARLILKKELENKDIIIRDLAQKIVLMDKYKDAYFYTGVTIGKSRGGVIVGNVLDEAKRIVDNYKEE